MMSHDCQGDSNFRVPLSWQWYPTVYICTKYRTFYDPSLACGIRILTRKDLLIKLHSFHLKCLTLGENLFNLLAKNLKMLTFLFHTTLLILFIVETCKGNSDLALKSTLSGKEVKVAVTQVSVYVIGCLIWYL